jgi:hypothetical protein
LARHQSFATRIYSDASRLTTSGSGPLNRRAQIRKNLVESTVRPPSDRVEEHLLGCFVHLEGLVRITNDHCHRCGFRELRVEKSVVSS